MTIVDELDLDAFMATFGWRARARCREMPTGVFYPHRGDNLGVAVARAVCRECPVRAECLDYALAARETVGIWGGLSERERRRLRATRSGRVAG